MKDPTKQDTFNRALTSFMNDFASGDAIRHMADRGMTVSQIVKKLSFPTKKELVAETVWKHYLNTGKIRLDQPGKGRVQKISYVQDVGPFGKTSLRRITEEIPGPEEEYVLCRFGRQIYKDRDAFLKSIEHLSPSDQEYILDLPWPIEDVWHVLDDRMRRIKGSYSLTEEKQ